MSYASYPDRATWLAARGGGEYRIGGSDIACILGSHGAYGTEWDVWERRKGHPLPPSQGLLDLWAEGLEWEAPALRMWADRTGVDLARYSTGWSLLTCDIPGREWAIGSPDALGPEGGVEAKTDRIGDVVMSVDDAITRGIPTERIGDVDVPIQRPGAIAQGRGCVAHRVCAQVYWYLAISGRPWWDVVALVPRAWAMPEVRIARIMEDPCVQSHLLDRVGEWRDRYLLGNDTPPMDASRACRRAQLTPDALQRREATADEVHLAHRIVELRREKADLHDDQKTLEAQLLRFMQGARSISWGDKGRATQTKNGQLRLTGVV